MTSIPEPRFAGRAYFSRFQFSLMPCAPDLLSLEYVSGVTGIPSMHLFWGEDSPGVVWMLEPASGQAVFITATRRGLEVLKEM